MLLPVVRPRQDVGDRQDAERAAERETLAGVIVDAAVGGRIEHRQADASALVAFDLGQPLLQFRDGRRPRSASRQEQCRRRQQRAAERCPARDQGVHSRHSIPLRAEAQQS